MNTQDLEFLWIIGASGQFYIRRVFQRENIGFDTQILSGLLTSLSEMSSQLFNSQFQELNIGDHLVFVKVHPDFQVVLCAKKTLKERAVYNLVEEVGETFNLIFGNTLKNPVIDPSTFDSFGPLIDNIFGIKTYIHIAEHDTLLKIIDKAITGNFNQQRTVQFIVEFLDTLSDYKLDILIDNVGDTLRMIMADTTTLLKPQKKRYARLL